MRGGETEPAEVEGNFVNTGDTMFASTLSDHGQTTIPPEVRDHLHVGDGGTLLYFAVGEGRVLVRAQTSVEQLKTILPHPDVAATIEDMNNAIGESAAERYLRR